MTNITVLGSTGSIGCSTLNIISQHPNKFKVFALTANNNVEKLFTQCCEYEPLYAVMRDVDAATQLQIRIKKAGLSTIVEAEESALSKVAAHASVDYVIAGIVGAAGLLPTLAAAEAGKRILLANKEALVMSGALFMRAAQQHNATILPIDSEHNAIFQCMPATFRMGETCPGVSKIILTASGGPFRTTSLSQFSSITPAQACAHPNWVMGHKISIDSATMMNKGLEVIEAHWLFNMPFEQIDVILHPQSIIHSMVEYDDGSVLAQMGNPDMRTPIAHCLGWPQRIQSGVKKLNLLDIGRLEFEEVNFSRYPALKLAYAALQAGGTATTVLNAANEIAVAAFMQNRLKFTHIPRLVEQVLANTTISPVDNLQTVLSADENARLEAQRLIAQVSKNYSL